MGTPCAQALVHHVEHGSCMRTALPQAARAVGQQAKKARCNCAHWPDTPAGVQMPFQQHIGKCTGSAHPRSEDWLTSFRMGSSTLSFTL